MNPSTRDPIYRHFSAVAPIVMSAVALAIVLIDVSLDHAAPQADEGTAAHLFQLLIAGQAPIVAVFAWRWWSRDPARALLVLAAQALAAAAALAPVLWMGL